ncbi:hypothetical protein GMD88_18210 [Pseudoflavonifractor sp. BIOML-A6]|jgi:hypothetical protein|nr:MULTISPECIES: hypothetical protein [unclassified Pseudoflavonifractor]MTQ98763.1 hypothetical protein [Pseudoflavonifractor sp. BIOML-A16]MTR08024.1 hypothetical protein [Pseudoflavonifractor sp. BIOML-A15]MTR34266.1 hypothetical protein [Pseudoflavonifractor sp. BIOML-A14]MTR75007.1 hypothetical protein [Pseudoflavonifractor sp. BIOML-A18]MTS66217.1 hypothetical protein [Pseudoflavonifractor sp. BIOML-A5]MTS73538.1 hypothetical protein [Pseudoflavonifractor sp. BIOML-A8]MTS92960.1 hypoth
MTSEQIIRLETALLDFVERAAEKDATAEEVQALAAVANVLASLII